MKSLILCLLLIVSSSAFASTNGYDLKMDLSLNGSPISSPRLIVKAGETATFTQKTKTEETFIEVIATDDTIQNHQGIMMKFVVGTIDKDGKKTILSKPQVFAKENVPAQFNISKNGNKSEFSLSVVAKRTVL